MDCKFHLRRQLRDQPPIGVTYLLSVQVFVFPQSLFRALLWVFWFEKLRYCL